MRFSIIIPVRKINSYLQETVTNLKNINYDDFEVIIVADEPEFYNFNDSRFRIISSGVGNPSVKRNLGAKIATGEILAFLDDDAFPDGSWLSNAKKIFDENQDIYALGGPAITPPEVPFYELVSGEILSSVLVSGFTVFRHKISPRRFVDDFPTVNLFVRKYAFDAVGGFDEKFWPGEDTKLCLALVKYFGKPFLYDPAPIVYHHRRNVFIPHLKQISRYGRYRGSFALIYPENSRILAYFVPSLFLIGFALGPVSFILIPELALPYFMVLGFYIGMLFIESARVSYLRKSVKMFLYFFFGVFFTHLTYGFNFIVGFLFPPKLELRKFDSRTGSYIGG